MLKKEGNLCKKAVALFLLLGFILCGCSQKLPINLDYKGDDFVKWNDPLFAKAVALYFDKTVEEVTYSDLEEIVYISIVQNDEDVGVVVSTATNPENYSFRTGKGNWKYFKLKKIQNLYDLAYFKNLEQVRIDTEQHTKTDFSSLQTLSHLKILNIGEKTAQKYWKNIVELPYIEELNANQSQVDYSLLEKMSHLKILEIIASEDNAKWLTIPKEGFDIELSFSILGDSNKYSNGIMEFLETHPNTTSIQNILLESFDDLTPLYSLPRLKTLTTSGYSSFAMNEEIGKMTSLESLNICFSTQEEFDLVKNLISIKELFFKGEKNSTSPISLAHLTSLTQLENLNIEASYIPKLDGVETLKNLKFLSVKGNVEDINALDNLTQLEYLNLSRNLISDLSPLENKPNLIYLDLLDNEYTNILPLKDSVKLKTLYLGLTDGSGDYPIPLEQAKEIIPLMKDLEWYLGPSDQELDSQCNYTKGEEKMVRNAIASKQGEFEIIRID